LTVGWVFGIIREVTHIHSQGGESMKTVKRIGQAVSVLGIAIAIAAALVKRGAKPKVPRILDQAPEGEW
jgi:hypothetical protein